MRGWISALKRGDAFERETRRLAEAVLRRDAALGWGLLESPLRLNIRTIDSVCAQIAGSLPVLSGSGGGQAPVTDAMGLYRMAAKRTLMQLGGSDAALNESLRTGAAASGWESGGVRDAAGGDAAVAGPVGQADSAAGAGAG